MIFIRQTFEYTKIFLILLGKALLISYLILLHILSNLTEYTYIQENVIKLNCYYLPFQINYATFLIL